MKFPDSLGGNSPVPNLYQRDGEGDRSQFRNEDTQVDPKVLTPPYPGSESVGPALYDLVMRTNRALDVQGELLHEAIIAGKRRKVIENVTGETDGSGNLDLKIFQVPQGYNFTATRVNVEAAGFTPASPFSNAAAWIALIRGTSFTVGSLLDFGPATPGSAIIPSIFSTSDNHAPTLNGGEILTLHIVGAAGLANQDIWCRCQGWLVPL